MLCTIRAASASASAAAAAAVVALSLAHAGPAFALSNVIDLFEDADFQLHLRGTSVLQATTAVTGNAANVIGGEREVLLKLREGQGVVNATTLGAAVGIEANPNGDGSGYLLLSDSIGALADLALTYNGPGSSGLGNLDFDTPYDAISVNFRAVQGVSRVYVRVDSPTGSGTLARFAYGANSSLISAEQASTNSLTFAFDAAAFVNVDFSNVTRVTVGFNNSDSNEVNGEPIGATDLAVNSITLVAIPEPASAMLAAAGLSLLACRRRVA